MKMLPVLFSLLLLALSSSSFGNEIALLNVDDFINFVSEVNERKNNYSGTTVYLDSDLSFSGKTFDPIGINRTYQFLGTFDGRGYVISDLQISASSINIGLFGYSTGLTIKNVVLDSSCSITSAYSGSDYVRVGGFIGYCWANDGKCIIENSVNMADVTFSGSISGVYSLYVGGIVGYLYSSSSYGVHVNNCANYGSVTDSGTVSRYAELGGIVGFSQGSLSYYNHVQNCLNYGTITHSGTTLTNLYIGGIVGFGQYYISIENCVSGGKITATASENNYIGSIMGNVGSNTHINYCYYTSDVGVIGINGTGTPSSTTGTPKRPATVNPELVSKLNSNATSCNWSKWLLLHLNGGSINNLEQELLVEIQGHLPNPVKKGNSFLFWCKDAECNEEFDPATESVSGITDLYAAWVNNTVTFDFDNGTTVNEIFAYNTEIIYPDDKKEGYTLSWDNYHELMPARDITVTAQWTPNNYTMTFDFGNGTTVNETFTYNTEIIYPDMNKEGYALSWDNYHELMPAKNITVTAQWTPNNYTVKFDFDNGTTVNETFTYNTEIIYPEMNKEGYTLSWDNYHELMPAKNITVTAQWTPNNYTVIFDANGGNIPEDKISKIVTFNEKYGKLPEPDRTGYMFIGWFTNEINGTEVTNETIVTTPDNHALYAHWEEVTIQVEIVFSKKDLTQDEVKSLIEQYTKIDFVITEFETNSKSGEIRVIIGFIDKKEAENFITDIKESSEMTEKIKNIDFITIGDGSFSTMIYPPSFLNALFL